MSKETLEQFLARVDASENLQEKIGEEIDIDAMIALGAEEGYEFIVDDFQDAVDDLHEATENLSDEDLEAVSGGAIDAEYKNLQADSETIRNSRDEYMTMFRTSEQKWNQMSTIASSLIKTMHQMNVSVNKNML